MCPWVSGGSSATPGARFCPHQSGGDSTSDIPDSLPSSYMSWVDPFCTDIAPTSEERSAPGSTGRWEDCYEILVV